MAVTALTYSRSVILVCVKVGEVLINQTPRNLLEYAYIIRNQNTLVT